MSRYYGGWAPYVPVAERRRKAEREMEKLRKKGAVVSPVRIEGRQIARSFWGKAWCDNLESYRDYENRLPRGRTYVRNGSVIDLQIAPGEVHALVNGSELYETSVSIRPLAQSAWRKLCADCAGGIDSLVELLQGRFSKAVMERLCRQDAGLFPRPAEIRFTCSCPDHAAMCKHVAAVLYGVGARLDEQPELLFRLRRVEGAELLAGAAADMPFAAGTPTAGRVLRDDDVAALFGIDMAMPPEPAVDSAPRGTKRAARHSQAQPGESPRAEASAAAAGKGKTVVSKRSALADVGVTKNSAARKPARKAATVPPTANASARVAKTTAIKAAPGARRAVPLSAATKAPQHVSRTASSNAEEKAESSASKERKLIRDRANWSWKALAAARKAKRS
jgi:uncharacterized Zn finger protein